MAYNNLPVESTFTVEDAEEKWRHSFSVHFVWTGSELERSFITEVCGGWNLKMCWSLIS